ncbi:sialate O-acetylesterase [Pelagicoccus mobilis]|uniref:Sialate O-acetylesterase domain-containing protein n=1 Tax=Pelagicoccus mobilis TaxID=415221 RepID=A0A934RUN4_9BACT|nr:sialate O-acetylesterase [Pelagicoccus mobilis]MBK1875444.1 hypothetical protein [Pelagicoccus mobilis]
MACLLFFVVHLGAESEGVTRVFLLGGQSNMVGQGLSSDLPSPYDAAQDDVMFWNSGWVPLSYGFGNKNDHFGPEVSFGRAIKDALPGDSIYLVKYGSNGKALYNDFKPGTGGNYIEMMDTFKAALTDLDEAGVEYEISGMLWMQGESDAYESQASAYEANLVNFIEVVREELNTPDMPFIIARVLDYFGGIVPPEIGEQTDPTQATIVRAAQVRVAENTPFVSWFDTDDYEVADPESNPGHYGAQGLLDMGKDFASALLEFSQTEERAENHWNQLFAFGDSFSDSGAGYVDGNGPTAIVYAARELGIPFTFATDPDAGNKGLNYAVSGARTGEGERRQVKDVILEYGMQNQVSDFAVGVQSGAISFDPERTLFFLAGGLNDRRLETVDTVNNVTLLVRRLHAVGARRFFIAVLPTEIASFNEVATRLNPELSALPAVLEEEFPDATIQSSRWGEFFDKVKLKAASYGIMNTADACAGRAIFDQDTTPRGDAESYYFYHSNHPSTAVHRHVGRMLAREFRAAVDSVEFIGQ